MSKGTFSPEHARYDHHRRSRKIDRAAFLHAVWGALGPEVPCPLPALRSVSRRAKWYTPLENIHHKKKRPHPIIDQEKVYGTKITQKWTHPCFIWSFAVPQKLTVTSVCDLLTSSDLRSINGCADIFLSGMYMSTCESCWCLTTTVRIHLLAGLAAH